MTAAQWKIFCDFKSELKKQINEWTKYAPELMELQKTAAKKAGTPDYPFETPVVYNKALDELTQNDEIKLIVIGDNPGKDEQLLKSNKYLVGQAGKLGESFFKKNPDLNIDFRKNVIILNKTPVHSAKTAQLKTIAKLGGKKIEQLIKDTQIWMAQKTAKLHIDLCCNGDKTDENNQTELWLVGYSELKQKGIFEDYKRELKNYYIEKNPQMWEKVFVYQHFSMNRFTINLSDFIKENCLEQKTLEAVLKELGKLHKNQVFDD